ncbi:MAG: MMPL family transporter [Desulfosalsimonadaceae bacterium]
MQLSKHTPLRGLFFLAVFVLAALAVIALFRLRLETDIVNTLPRGNAVLEEGSYVLLHHPYQNQVFIDLGLERKNPDKLVEAAAFIESELHKSGLFKTVGMEEMGRLFPRLAKHAVENLPVLFTAEALENDAAPLLEAGALEQRVTKNLSGLYTMESTGMSRLAVKDPLGLGNLVLEKLKHLVPTQEVHFYKGRLLSPDERHLFIIVNPETTRTGTDLARRIDDTLEQAERALRQKYEGTDLEIRLTPVGAYRAVLDNETTARGDTKRALLFVTAGIACLLMLSFPRPHIGLLSFLPAIFGTLCALAVYSIWRESISVMTIGFGGAIISITVDHGIAYLLFLDRPYETRGKSVSREVRAVAFLAALTTVGAFSLLGFSGFPVLVEIGQFAALGIAFSFFFVHSFFPLLFPVLPPAKRAGRLPLQALVDRLTVWGGKSKAAAAVALFLVLAIFANPDFDVDIASMNTVSKETIAAENMVSETWGQRLFDKIYLIAEAPDRDALQQHSDRLAARLAAELEDQTLSEAFVPSMIFPGEQRCRENLAAWRNFWQKHDKALLQKRMQQVAEKMGMPAGIFSDVYSEHSFQCKGGLPIDPAFHDMLGIHHSNEDGTWLLFSSLAPGENYDPESFFQKYSAEKWLHVLDPAYYSQTISDFLSHTFIRMVIFIGAAVTVLLLLFFMDAVLTAIALLPLGFSMVCTLGVMGLADQPLSIPGLMLSVVVIGMGLDYSLYFVRGYQRYQDEAHPFQAHIRMTIFLAGVSTLIGFGTLASGGHNFMRDLGQLLVLGIVFVLAGTFALLPPLLRYLFKPVVFSDRFAAPGSVRHKKRIRRLYRRLEAYPRLFARFKCMMDPMFAELPELVGKPSVVMDIGCGYGVTSAWLISMNPRVRICAMEPDPERARIATRIVGGFGEVFQAGAPALPDCKDGADLVLMLDMIHYLSDAQFGETLQYLRPKLAPGARVLIRVTIPSAGRIPMFRRIETLRLRLARTPSYFRPAEQIRRILAENGFTLLQDRPSGIGREEHWFAAEAAQ